MGSHARQGNYCATAPQSAASSDAPGTPYIVANMGEGKRGRSFFGLHCRCDVPTRQARRAESTAG